MNEPETGKCGMQFCRISPDKPFIEFSKSEIEQSIVARFEKLVERYPSRLAVKSQERQLTYDELNRAANRIARTIVAHMGPKNEPAAIFLKQGTRLITAILAALKAGKSYMALDTASPASRNVSITRHAGPCLVLTDKEHLPSARKFAGSAMPFLIIDDIEDIENADDLDLPISPMDTAYIIYTSGSTGQPKGVSQNHQNVLHNIMRCTNMLHIASDDRLSLLWSCSFAASVPNIFGALLNGAALFIYDLRREGISNLAGWLEKEKITIYHSVPTAFRHLFSTLAGNEDFSSLRLIKLSGEPVHMKDVELYRKFLHDNCIFHVSYASTETNIVRQFFCDRHTTFISRKIPAGYEVEDMEVLIIDEDGNEAGFERAGEIVIRSRYLPASYHGQPSHAQQAFLPDKDRPGCLRYKTGDVGYLLPDGCLVLLGRKDHQLKIRGYRIETSEVETALCELATVKEAAVMARDDQYGGKNLVAYVVPDNSARVGATGGTVTAGELRAALKDTLPDYMVPSHFVFLDALPLTSSGKVDRKSLPAPGPQRPETGNEYTAPGTLMEVMLANIWSSVLGISRAGVNDNFFDLGGNSLLAGRIAAEIKKRTGSSIAVFSIFQWPTIKQLAEAIVKGGPARGFPPVLPMSSGPGSPFFWIGFNPFLTRSLGSKRPVYAVPLQGDYEENATYNSIEELAAVHLKEILAICPKGPYLLGGYCFWALVAFEIAQQLFKTGQDVPLLTLVAPPSQCLPAQGGGAPQQHRNKQLKVRLDLSPVKPHYGKTPWIRAFTRRVSNETGEPIYGKIHARIRQYIYAAHCQTSILLGRAVPDRLLEFHKVRTSRKYEARPYPGKAVVFLPEIEKGHQPQWRALAGEHVHVIPGARHITMREESCVMTWGRQLACYLDNIGK